MSLLLQIQLGNFTKLFGCDSLVYETLLLLYSQLQKQMMYEYVGTE